MSAPDPASTAAAPALRLSLCPADIVELVAFAGAGDALKAALRAQAIELPAFGRTIADAQRLILCVRPDRWLLLTAPATGLPAEGSPDATCQAMIGAAGAAIDQSSGHCLLCLAGVAWREVLARGCRLDLDPRRLAAGAAAATTLAQVPVVIVPRASSVLLLTPSSTTQHVCEWLAETARHDGFVRRPDLPFIQLVSKEIA